MEIAGGSGEKPSKEAAMKIESLMTRDVRTCRADDSFAEAARIMWECDCGCVPVVDAELGVVGMITDRDICMAAYTQGRSLEEGVVESAMSHDVACCRPMDDVREAEELMRALQIRRLPVVDEDNQLVGLLSLNDIACEATRARHLIDKEVAFDEIGLTIAAIGAHRRGPDGRVNDRSSDRIAGAFASRDGT